MSVRLTRCHQLLVLSFLSLLVLLTPTQARANALAAVAQMSKLSETGQFDKVLSVLKTTPGVNSSPEANALAADIQRLLDHRAQSDQEREDAYKLAMTELVDHLGADELEEALAKAIEARRLSSQPESFGRQPVIQHLTDKVKVEITAAEQRKDWLEALTLYRFLSAVHDDPAMFRDEAERAERHLRILRFYAPDEWKKLQEARRERDKKAVARRRAKDAKEGKEEDPKEDDIDEPIDLQDEQWQDRLKDIRATMLRPILAHAARRHVRAPGYLPLMKGAAKALLALVETQGMERAFPTFSNQLRREQFRAYCLRVIRDLDARDAGVGGRNGNLGGGGDLDFLDTVRLVEEIFRINAQTLNLPEQVMVYEMADGALAKLDDFTSIIWPRDKEQFSRTIQGRFYGVGIQITRRDDKLTVVSPLSGTPAQRAGVRANDVIIQVNGQSTASWSLNKAVREITGPEGTEVVLRVKRDNAKSIDFRLTRAEIPLESIKGWVRDPKAGAEDEKWDYYIDRQHKLGYIRLSQFLPQSAADMDAAINAMQQKQGLKGLILDLRSNPGGLLTASAEVTDRFVSRGRLVATVDANDDITGELRAHATSTHGNIPLVVLINQGSASASEIVSGALQDHERAIIVGTRSFGKGSVQDLYPIDGGRASLKLTTQYYTLPGKGGARGRIIHREPTSKTWGIEPDVVVEMTDKQIIDSLKLRQELDVLHGPNEAKGKDEPAPVATDLLTKGLDTQLEVGVLLLRTKLLAEQLRLAHGG